MKKWMKWALIAIGAIILMLLVLSLFIGWPFNWKVGGSGTKETTCDAVWQSGYESGYGKTESLYLSGNIPSLILELKKCELTEKEYRIFKEGYDLGVTTGIHKERIRQGYEESSSVCPEDFLAGKKQGQSEADGKYAPMEQSIADKLDACLNPPEPEKKEAPPKKEAAPKKTAPKADPPPAPKKDEVPIQEAFKSPAPSQRIDGGNVGGVEEFLPVYSGDYGTTTSIEETPGTAYLLHYLSDAAFKRANPTTEVPEMNEQRMTFKADIGYWINIDYGTILTRELILANDKYCWSVYIGEFIYSGGSYDMWIPHETLKPIMKQVRGREDGKATDAELQKMGESVPGIKQGTISQNGIAVKASGKDYYGWQFCTPINYKTK